MQYRAIVSELISHVSLQPAVNEPDGGRERGRDRHVRGPGSDVRHDTV